jgi:hypothetical protein
VHDRILGVAAAIEQRKDPILLMPIKYTSPCLRNRPCHLETKDLRGPIGGRIITLTLEGVGPIKGRRVNLDEYLVRPRLRSRYLANGHVLGITLFGDDNRIHTTMRS